MKRRTKVLAVAASVVVVVLCATGVAFAADGAVPGDTLYGFDRVVESIGIGDGGLQERLTEATALAAKGDTEQALAHAAEACACLGTAAANGDSANAALLTVANAVATANQGESDQIRARVAEMLQWMASTQAAGEDFSEGVATRVRAMSVEAKGSDQEPVQNQAGDCEQDGEREQNKNGDVDETQNMEREQNGDCVQDGDCEQYQYGEQQQNQSGDCDQSMTQTNRPDGAGNR